MSKMCACHQRGAKLHGVSTDGMELKIEANLSPVGEDLSISTIRDELVRKLGYTVVKVVHDHEHDCGCLLTLSRIVIDWVRPATIRLQ